MGAQSRKESTEPHKPPNPLTNNVMMREVFLKIVGYKFFK